MKLAANQLRISKPCSWRPISSLLRIMSVARSQCCHHFSRFVFIRFFFWYFRCYIYLNWKIFNACVWTIPRVKFTTETTINPMLLTCSAAPHRVGRGPTPPLPPSTSRWSCRCFNMRSFHIIAHVSSRRWSRELMQRSEKPITCASLGVGMIVVGAIPRPSILRLKP